MLIFFISIVDISLVLLLIMVFFFFIKQRNRETWHFNITVLIIVYFYICFVCFCIFRNLGRIGKNFDIKPYIENIMFLYSYFLSASFKEKIIGLLLILCLIIFVLILFLLLIILVKSIKLSFQKFHYLLMNVSRYRFFIFLLIKITENIYLSPYNNNIIMYKKKKYLFRSSTAIIQLLYIFPGFFSLCVICFDPCCSNFVISTYFTVFFFLPLYYFILNLFDFYTNSIFARAHDMLVYYSIYLLQFNSLDKQLSDSVKEFIYIMNINKRHDSLTLLSELQDSVWLDEQTEAFIFYVRLNKKLTIYRAQFSLLIYKLTGII